MMKTAAESGLRSRRPEWVDNRSPAAAFAGEAATQIAGKTM